MSFRSRAERHMLRESRRYPALSTAPPPLTSRPSGTGDKTTSLLQPHEPGSGSAEAQLLLKQLAGIVAQNPRADHALRTAIAGPNTVCRAGQIGVDFAAAGQT